MSDVLARLLIVILLVIVLNGIQSRRNALADTRLLSRITLGQLCTDGSIQRVVIKAIDVIAANTQRFRIDIIECFLIIYHMHRK